MKSRTEGTGTSREGSSGSLDRVLLRSPLQAAFRWRASRSLAILAYHGIDDPDTFSLHLDHIRKACSPVSLDEVVASFHRRSGLPDRAVLITFDDADRSLLDVGRDLLSERAMPAVAFVVTGHLDGDQPFWWTEVEELIRARGKASGLEHLGPDQAVRRMKRLPDEQRRALLAELQATSPIEARRHFHLRAEELSRLERAGIAIGNHTTTHPCLPRCGDGSVVTEVTESHIVLSDVLGKPPTAFAYPNGDWDPRAEDLLRELGYQAGFLFDHRLNIAHVHNRLSLSRLRVDSSASMDRFRLILSGLHSAILRTRDRLNGSAI